MAKAKKKSEKIKDGRPTKFTKENQERIKVMTELGHSDKEICEHLKVDIQSLFNWKDSYPDFFASLPDWRIGADLRVEAALFKSCTGGIIIEQRPQSVMVGDGMSRVEQHPQEKYIPPNVTAAKFWLTNRKASEWRDRREFDINEVKKLTDEELAIKAKAIMAKVDK